MEKEGEEKVKVKVEETENELVRLCKHSVDKNEVVVNLEKT